ncbi:MAG TPA: ATP-dependent 6-phosphofructokinase [Spirochaetota bacterium]|nr:ATP-dependent 6-phosphofructokinase [Spirochaetota bacterium]HPF05229.1 ATP-dependent 6-phosphofructokinase [Spirochaetota bacterium]HPJ40845.1 ATP-dependent 6-phosphofructokinase [Spirochaetota bacterium]HPR37154.1 ATP-dependent 6-phosphofructokinase [Spirochaetota bacterium]HRX46504.1 ATP-dependent 6-phosphofructokinase [Spirochaetota bacterium]
MPLTITQIGERKIKSPLIDKFNLNDMNFVKDEKRMLYNVMLLNQDTATIDSELTFELAGPRETLYFEPENTVSAIVTCGGLCPGLNDVIRSIVMESYYRYGAKKIYGIRYGYNGLNPAKGFAPIELAPDIVRDIHMNGGTMLGSSRGGTDDMNILMDTLQKLKINILYTIGGDGTLKGAHEIARLAKERNMELAVVGVPKTIDNDVSFIQRSFGFETAFSQAVNAIVTAHVEAKGAPNCIGLVKLMGRHSGFIAANATLAMNDVNFVLVPEVPFELDGENGLLKHLEKRLIERQHAVIVVAEGAGQNLMEQDDNVERDASGNVKLKDIGLFLKERIEKYFKQKSIEMSLKYIDPSYMIRSSPAVPNDSIYCAQLGQYAVHAGMAGKTDLVIGQWNNNYTHVPIELAISKQRKINPTSRFWFTVLDATGQPEQMVNS